MARRLTITIDDELEMAIREAPRRLGLERSASASERMRAWARRGYEAALEREIDEARLETYRDWAEAGEIGVVPRAALKASVAKGRLFQD